MEACHEIWDCKAIFLVYLYLVSFKKNSGRMMMAYHTITTTNLSVVGSGPIWAPVQRDKKWKPRNISIVNSLY